MNFRAPEVIYKNGHFYDSVSKQRIILKDSAKVLLIADNPEFLTVDPNNQPHDCILEPAAQKKEIIRLSKGRNYHKLLNRGSLLYFEISVTIKKHNGREKIKTVFEVLLNEDLYCYDMNQTGKKANYKLAPCASEVVRNPTENVAYFETIYADSLNSAYSKTFVHYFGVSGASTCNAFDTFYYWDKNRSVLVRQLSALPVSIG